MVPGLVAGALGVEVGCMGPVVAAVVALLAGAPMAMVMIIAAAARWNSVWDGGASCAEKCCGKRVSGEESGSFSAENGAPYLAEFLLSKFATVGACNLTPLSPGSTNKSHKGYYEAGRRRSGQILFCSWLGTCGIYTKKVVVTDRPNRYWSCRPQCGTTST
ncbi:hypothetical protein MPH_08530 [Macrophomina phaseolina MS6]|uniref:Uncharacterized protein n=1 Tax=Macrophomina phaseolina (strain MS6) TaxID=1126212 RepID=K2RVQ8_MACPH|nr:hypothetical protein MPH_08530 [Macrophomina phaseolina MS6]